MPFLNKSEATKRSRDRKENGKSTNATNCRSRVGLSTSFCIDMICMRGGYIVQRHNEIRDLEAKILQAVSTDVEMEPVLQEVTVEVLPRGANKEPDAGLDIRAQGF